MDYTNRDQEALRGADPRLEILYGDVTLGVKGFFGKKKFHYIFSYTEGGPVSFSINEREWLYRAPVPAFWRAATDNDRGNKFPIKSGMWLSADMFIQCVEIKVAVDGKEIPFPAAPENNRYSAEERADSVTISFLYETVTRPAAGAEVSYQVDKTGKVRTQVRYFGKEGLPELPVFGLRIIMPTCADRFVYEGLSGETYPDRMAGGIPGIYEVQGLPVTPHLRPQDCGVHMDSKWLEIYRSTGMSNTQKEKKTEALKFELDGLAFSCLPYTASELENATHQEELPPARRTVLCIYGAVRGVGGINAWGADVDPPYHIDGESDICFSFMIVPL